MVLYIDHVEEQKILQSQKKIFRKIFRKIFKKISKILTIFKKNSIKIFFTFFLSYLLLRSYVNRAKMEGDGIVMDN